MAITTQAGAHAGAQPPFHWRKAASAADAAGLLTSTFYAAGEPSAAAAPTPGINGASLTSYAGQIPFANPASGNTYLYRFEVSHGNSPVIHMSMLCDRLWHNSGLVVTTTTAQAITTPAWPARDLDNSANGRGVHVGIEFRSATTNPGAITNCTLNYTNSAGTAGRTATISSIPITVAAVTFIPFELQAGDEGVRSIEGITLGTSLVTGAIHLVAFRILDMCCNLSIGSGTTQNQGQGMAARVNGMLVRRRDMHAAGFVRLWDDTVPFVLQLLGNASGSVQTGIFQVAQG